MAREKEKKLSFQEKVALINKNFDIFLREAQVTNQQEGAKKHLEQCLKDLLTLLLDNIATILQYNDTQAIGGFLYGNRSLYFGQEKQYNYIGDLFTRLKSILGNGYLSPTSSSPFREAAIQIITGKINEAKRVIEKAKNDLSKLNRNIPNSIVDDLIKAITVKSEPKKRLSSTAGQNRQNPIISGHREQPAQATVLPLPLPSSTPPVTAPIPALTPSIPPTLSSSNTVTVVLSTPSIPISKTVVQPSPVPSVASPTTLPSSNTVAARSPTPSDSKTVVQQPPAKLPQPSSTNGATPKASLKTAHKEDKKSSSGNTKKKKPGHHHHHHNDHNSKSNQKNKADPKSPHNTATLTQPTVAVIQVVKNPDGTQKIMRSPSLPPPSNQNNDRVRTPVQTLVSELDKIKTDAKADIRKRHPGSQAHVEAKCTAIDEAKDAKQLKEALFLRLDDKGKKVSKGNWLFRMFKPTTSYSKHSDEIEKLIKQDAIDAEQHKRVSAVFYKY